MAVQSIDTRLDHIEQLIRSQFPAGAAGPRLEFARQYFSRHVELWVYTLELKDYDGVKALCDEVARSERLDQEEPEVWLLVKTWTGHWPGGESEEEIRRRRDDFRSRHNLPVRGS